MKLKNFLIPLTAVAMAMTLTACAEKTNDVKNSTQEQSSSTIKLNTKRGELDVVKSPKTVVSFDVAVIDMIQRYNIKVENLVTPKITAKYLEKTVSGKDKAGSFKEPNYEYLSTVKPDVIFANQRQKDLVAELDKVGKTALFINDNKKYFESMMDFNMQIGKVFGVEQKVKEDKEKFEKIIKEISGKAKNNGKKALVIMTNEGKITAFGSNSRFGYIHTLYGFKPVDENIQESTHGNEINYEYISKMNPDIIFYVDRNTVVKSKTNSTASATLDNELIKNTNAGKAGAIYEIEAQYAYLVGNGLTAFEKISEVLAKASN